MEILTITSLLTIMKKARIRNKLLKLPLVKLEFAKRSFKYMVAIPHNDLARNIPVSENDQDFRKFFNDYVFSTFKLFSIRIFIICARCMFSFYLNFHSSSSYSGLNK